MGTNDGPITAREEYEAFVVEVGVHGGMIPFTDENHDRMEAIRERARAEGTCMKEYWSECGYPNLSRCDGCPVL